MSKAGWDLRSTHSLEGAAKWLLKAAGAQVVLIVRAEDVAFDVALDLRPKDAVALVERVMPEAMARLNQNRLELREKARKKAEKHGG